MKKSFLTLILSALLLFGTAASAFGEEPLVGHTCYPDSATVAVTTASFINNSGLTNAQCTFKKFEKGVYYCDFSANYAGYTYSGETVAAITELKADGTCSLSIVYIGFNPVNGVDLSYLNSTNSADWYKAECLYNQLTAQ